MNTVQRTYKYRFYPNQEQQQLLAQTFGCVRKVYNLALEARSSAWKDHKRSLSFGDTASLLKGWKATEELSFLKEVSAVPLQQALRHLDKGFQAFFKGQNKYPQPKRLRNRQSAHFMSNAFKYEDGKLTLAKMKSPLNIRWSRRFRGEPTSVCVSKTPSGEYYISMLAKEEITPLAKTEQTTGIDLGVKSTVVDAQGNNYPNPRHFVNLFSKLRRAQKTLSRRKKGSGGYNRARLKVAKYHERIRRARLDFLHKLSTFLVNENQVIGMEDLNVKGMMKNKRLAKAIGDVGMRILRDLIAYKTQWYGRTLVIIDRFKPTSKQCHHCLNVVEALPLSVRQWTCAECGTVHDRDHNASQNIHREAMELYHCTVGLTGTAPALIKASGTRVELQ